MMDLIYTLGAKSQLTFNDKEICNCECHTNGMMVMHCFPCCEYCYEKYINEDGTLNEEKYQKLIKGN